jgi:hypothetical protein
MVEEELEKEAVETEELPPEEEVKVAANEFLGDILKDIAREMDKEEVFTLNTEHFNKAVKKYKMIEYQQKRIDRVKKLLEKQRAEIDEVVTEIDLTREL